MVVSRNVLGRSVGNVEIQEMTGNGYVLGVVANFPQSQKCGGGMHQQEGCIMHASGCSTAGEGRALQL